MTRRQIFSESDHAASVCCDVELDIFQASFSIELTWVALGKPSRCITNRIKTFKRRSGVIVV